MGPWSSRLICNLHGSHADTGRSGAGFGTGAGSGSGSGNSPPRPDSAQDQAAGGQTWQGWRVRLTDRLNKAQKIVIVIATGVALAAIGILLANRGSVRPPGHYISALRHGFAALRPRPPRWLRVIIWLVLDAIWALTSIVVLRSPRRSDGP